MHLEYKNFLVLSIKKSFGRAPEGFLSMYVYQFFNYLIA